MTDLDKPIGYWLRLLDDRVERRFEADLASHGLARRHWQALNVLAGGDPQGTAADEIASALAPFWKDDAVQLDEVLNDLSSLGWIAQSSTDGRAVALTEAGRTGHGQVRQAVEATRAVIMEGLDPQDYLRTVEVLAHMTRNLAAASPAPTGQPTRR